MKMDLQSAFDAGFEAVKKYCDKHFGEFEARLAKLEARPELKFCGSHQRALTYARGSIVNHDGSCWIALRQVEGERPGEGQAWQLLVKKGQDAR